MKASYPDAIEKPTRFALYGVCFCGVLPLYSSIFFPCLFLFLAGPVTWISHFFLFSILKSYHYCMPLVRCFFLFFSASPYALSIPLSPFEIWDSKRGLMCIVSYGTCVHESVCVKKP